MHSMLIIDDDIEFCSMLRDYLASHNIELRMEHTGPAGLAAVWTNKFDMILLDIVMPGMDGFEVLAYLRTFSSLSVLMLSSLSEEADRIFGLDYGADDYLAKSISTRELVSRIRAILRRDARYNSSAKDTDLRVPVQCCVPGLMIDVVARDVFYKGNKLPLTDVEFLLLQAFIESPGTVLEREDLVARVFDRPFNPLDRSLDMHISRLRRKLDVFHELNDPIKTIRSSGYLFSPSASFSTAGLN
jgi:two-component system response regulator CpxR